MELVASSPGPNPSTAGGKIVREIRRELVEFIKERTGIDRKVIVEVLRAEESFFVMQIEKALKKKTGRDRS